MKTPLVIIALLLAVAAFADDLVTVRGTRYTGVTVKRVDPDGLAISHDDGFTKIPFSDLPPELQKKYGQAKAGTATLPTIDGQQAPAQRASQPPFDLEKAKEKAAPFKEQTLVFKGFYLGMPADDALALINYYMAQAQPPPTAKPKAPNSDNEGAEALALLKLLGALANAASGNPDEGTDPFQIFRDDKGIRVARSEHGRPFAVAGSGGVVTAFEISKTVRDKLFDAAQTPTREFLKTFIASYNIPSLEVSRVELATQMLGIREEAGFQIILQHRSPQGYELTYWDKPLILDDKKKMFVSTVPAESITIKKIETEKKRKSKFD